MGRKRQQEAKTMAETLGISLTTLNFSDMGLPFVPMKKLVAKTLPIIRELNTRAIFSFHPHELSEQFDHPDHSVVGEIARHVGAAADVKHFYPKSPAMRERPNLYLWTSQRSNANRRLVLTLEMREQRNEHLITHYPSQFKAGKRLKWQPIFDQITHWQSEKHQELYKQIR